VPALRNSPGIFKKNPPGVKKKFGFSLKCPRDVKVSNGGSDKRDGKAEVYGLPALFFMIGHTVPASAARRGAGKEN
jgi:hypothetical protein